MKIDLDFVKRIILSFKWLSLFYFRFRFGIRKNYGVKHIKIHDFLNWHGGACYFTGKFNESRVFIKTLHSKFGILQNEQTAIRLLDQTSIQNHIPQLHIQGQIGRDEFIVLDFIHGNTLNHHLENSLSEIKPQERTELANQLIRILEGIQDVKVVHRDLRPDNIFITDKNGLSLKLIDFSFVIDSINWNKEPRFHDITRNEKAWDIWKALGQVYKPEPLKWDDAYAIHKILSENNHLFNLGDDLLEKVKDKIGNEEFAIDNS